VLEIFQAIEFLCGELEVPAGEISSAPVVDWAALLLRLALRRGARTLRLLPVEGRLRIFLDETALPPVPWVGPALSRFIVVCGLEKGEEARGRSQAATKVVQVDGQSIELSTRTVPLGPFREEIHIDLCSGRGKESKRARLPGPRGVH
jgi:hypothetical protein